MRWIKAKLCYIKVVFSTAGKMESKLTISTWNKKKLIVEEVSGTVEVRWVLIVVIDKNTNKTEIHKSQLLCTKQHLAPLVTFVPANTAPFWCMQKSQKIQNVTWYFPFVITATCCLNSFISFCSFFCVFFYMHSIIQIQRVFLK